MKLNEVSKELYDLNSRIKSLFKQSDYATEGELFVDGQERLTADERFTLQQLRAVMFALEDVTGTLDYLRKPTHHEGIIYRNGSGRYECEYHEFTSGNAIEFLRSDDHGYDQWELSRVEYSDSRGGYYIVGFPEVKMDGLRVRFR